MKGISLNIPRTRCLKEFRYNSQGRHESVVISSERGRTLKSVAGIFSLGVKSCKD